MQHILNGLKRFQTDVYPRHRDLFEALSSAQDPHVLFITCGDSRVVPSLMTQTQPGELFLSRQVGNIVPPHGSTYGGTSATVEYAVAALKVDHVVVCGHSDCGAMKAVLHPERVKTLPNVAKWLDHSAAARMTVDSLYPDAPDSVKLDRLIEQNVVLQMRHIETHPPVAAALATGALTVHGWVYDIETGTVRAYNTETRRFEPIAFSEPDESPKSAAEEVMSYGRE